MLMFLGLHMLGFDFDVLMLANFKDLLHEDVGSAGHDPVTPWCNGYIILELHKTCIQIMRGEN